VTEDRQEQKYHALAQHVEGQLRSFEAALCKVEAELRWLWDPDTQNMTGDCSALSARTASHDGCDSHDCSNSPLGSSITPRAAPDMASIHLEVARLERESLAIDQELQRMECECVPCGARHSGHARLYSLRLANLYERVVKCRKQVAELDSADEDPADFNEPSILDPTAPFMDQVFSIWCTLTGCGYRPKSNRSPPPRSPPGPSGPSGLSAFPPPVPSLPSLASDHSSHTQARNVSFVPPTPNITSPFAAALQEGGAVQGGVGGTSDPQALPRRFVAVG